MYGPWNMVHDGQMDGWTYGHIDRQKKWHIEVGALPKNWKKKFFSDQTDLLFHFET